MSLTPAQRAEQNRRNAQKSTGPQTVEGKARSRANAFKHGLRAEILPLPGENPQVAAERAAAWHDYYQPQSPAAHHLVNECARATLFADRFARFHTSIVTEQMRDAQRAWHADRSAAIAQHIERLHNSKNPDAARVALLATAGGCAYLLDRWIQIEHRLLDRGLWKSSDIAEAVRLLGGIKANPDAWVVRVFACLIGLHKNASLLAKLFQPDRQPPSLRDTYTLNNLPNCDDAFRWLATRVAAEITMLRTRHWELDERADQPALADAAVRGFLAPDQEIARLHLRYHNEARNAFQRAFKTLLSTLEADAEISPNEADSTDPDAADVVKTRELPESSSEITIPASDTPCTSPDARNTAPPDTSTPPAPPSRATPRPGRSRRTSASRSKSQRQSANSCDNSRCASAFSKPARIASFV